MKNLKITIPLKPESWNVLARQNFWIVKKFKDKWSSAVEYQILANKIKPVSSYPVTLYIEAHWKFRKEHDIDALCTKFAVDALVKQGILENDDLTHVDCMVVTGKTGQPTDELIIEIKRSP